MTDRDDHIQRVKQLGAFLERRREQLGLSQSEMGRRTSTNQSLISRIEKGRFERDLGVRYLRPLAEAYEVPVRIIVKILLDDDVLDEPFVEASPPAIAARIEEMLASLRRIEERLVRLENARSSNNAMAVIQMLEGILRGVQGASANPGGHEADPGDEPSSASAAVPSRPNPRGQGDYES